jgi:RND family efflux transporter MFP subunit
MEKHMKNALKLISLLMILGLALVSCGAPGAKTEADIDYKKTMNDIIALGEEIPSNASEVDARRYLAKVEKALQPVSSLKGNNDLTIVPVNVQAVKAESITQKVEYLGNINGDPSVVVYPKLTDLISEIYVENGDFVNKDQVLGIISDATVRASKAQAEAAYLSAKSQVANVNVEYERMKTLYEAKAISDSQWDQIVTQKDVAEAGLKQAKAALDMADTQLGYAKITAPISGYVSNLAYEIGDMSTPQKPFVTINQIKTVQTKISVTERDLGQIKAGQRAEISVEAYPSDIFNGTVVNVSPVIDPITRTAQVEIKSDNADMRLKPGMFARVAIVTNELENVLTVNKAATGKQTVLKRFGDNLRDDKVVETYSCFIVRDGVALEVPIEIGVESKTKYEVTKGLNEGDLVVVMGQNNLSDSTLVNIVE